VDTKEAPAPIYNLRVRFYASTAWNGMPTELCWPWDTVTPDLARTRNLQLHEGRIVQSFPDGRLTVLTDTGRLHAVSLCECEVLLQPGSQP